MPINPPIYHDDAPLPGVDRLLIAYSTAVHPLPINAIASALLQFNGKANVEMTANNLEVAAFEIGDPEFGVGDAITHLRKNHPEFDNIEFEPDQVISVSAFIPRHPIYAAQWALDRIEAEAAWQILTPAAPVIVAVIDSGAQITHPGFNAGQLTGMSALAPPIYNAALGWLPDPDVTDDDGHGTMVLGTIAGHKTGPSGINGVASKLPSAGTDKLEVLLIKANDVRNPPGYFPAVWGMLLALWKNAQVINISWHILGPAKFLQLVVSIADAMNVLVVAAAGNQGEDNNRAPGTIPASWSSSFKNVMSVMASDEFDRKAGFSNYGANVHIAAPGTHVATTGIYYNTPRYTVYSGTSASAPHVTAAAALMLAIRPALDPETIRQLLINHADKPIQLKGLNQADGRLDLFATISSMMVRIRPLVTPGGRLRIDWQRNIVPVHIRASQGIETWKVSIIDPADTDRAGAEDLKVLSRRISIGRGWYQTDLPNTELRKVVIRLRCNEKTNLFADSEPFDLDSAADTASTAAK